MGLETRGAWNSSPGHDYRSVDDFLFGGSPEDKEWTSILERIKNRFKWGDWDQGSFVQCRVQIDTIPEGFALSQPRYLDTVDEIPVSTQRRKGHYDSTRAESATGSFRSLELVRSTDSPSPVCRRQFDVV